MPESDELSSLPPSSPLHKLRSTTIDIAKRLDALIAHLEDESAFADLHIEIRRGQPTKLRVDRSFRLDG